MEKNTGYIIAIVILASGLLYLWFTKDNNNTRVSNTASRSADAASADLADGDIKCELQDSNGRTVTITGRGPEFEKLCQSQKQPVTLYGYQYYPQYYYRWYRPFGWRRWSWGGHGIGGPGGPGSGTGGGVGPGTGGGSGPGNGGGGGAAA